MNFLKNEKGFPVIKKENVSALVLTTFIALMSIVGTVFAVSKQFVSSSEFSLFTADRTLRLNAIDSRLDRIELKLDKLLDERRRR